jgi:dihydrofolate reductase
MYIKAFIGVTSNDLITIGDASQPARFSSKHCMENIQRQLADYDHLLIGAATVRAYGGRSMSHQSHIVYGRTLTEFKTSGKVSFINDLGFLPERAHIACLGGQTLLKQLIALGKLDELEITVTDNDAKNGVLFDDSLLERARIGNITVLNTEEIIYNWIY